MNFYVFVGYDRVRHYQLRMKSLQFFVKYTQLQKKRTTYMHLL